MTHWHILIPRWRMVPEIVKLLHYLPYNLMSCQKCTWTITMRKLLGFFQSENLPIPYCVVKTFEYNHSQFSVIGTKWKQCFSRRSAHCLMIPYDNTQNRRHTYLGKRMLGRWIFQMLNICNNQSIYIYILFTNVSSSCSSTILWSSISDKHASFGRNWIAKEHFRMKE